MAIPPRVAPPHSPPPEIDRRLSLTDAEVRARIAAVPVWYHRIPIRPGIVTPGVSDPTVTLPKLELPEDCRGLRVLDLGTRDGFFAFELERRGAEVVAVDYLAAEQTGFATVRELLGSGVRYLQENVYRLSAERMGSFDLVLFLGLLYHLPDPLLALRIVRGLCRDRLILESHVIDHALLLPDGRFVPLRKVSRRLAQIPLMQFYPRRSLYDDPTNYWGPNLACLVAMLGESKFEVVSHRLESARAIVQCRAIEDADLDYHNQIARGLNPCV